MHLSKVFALHRMPKQAKAWSLLYAFLFLPQAVNAQEVKADTISTEQSFEDVVVTATNGTRSKYRIDNVDIIGQGQLIRAACCNLGESFTTNPSVDVSYSDAATGAKQIKLLADS